MDKRNAARKELEEAYDDPRGDTMWRAGLARAMAVVEKYYGTTPTPPAGQVDAVASDLLRLAHNADNHTIASLKQHLFVIHKELEQSILKASGAEHIAGLVAALKSIAANGCCDTCQEAKLVAQHALEALPLELRGK